MIKKILVINPFGIGDVIFSMTLVEALKKTLPQVQVGFLGNERTVELLRMNASIDVCHEFDRDELRGLRQKNFTAYVSRALAYWLELKGQDYDTVFDLSLGREYSFVAFSMGIRRRIGFDYKKRGFFLTHRLPFSGYEKKHVVDWQLSLLTAVGIEHGIFSSRLPLRISSASEEKASRFLAENGIGAGLKFFALAPGGGRSWGENAIYKQWSPDRFAEVARRVADDGGSRILLLGDREESPLLLQLQKKLSTSAVTVAGESLELVAALLKRSQFLLCNDGGLLHLANALGVKTVSIFGPVDESVYGPYGSGTAHELLVEPVPCRPCYKQFHFPPCEHERRCLEELSSEKVLAAIRKIS